MDNDVWGSLSNIASQVISYKRDVAIAKLSNPARAVTTAAPSASPTPQSPNKFPGTFGPYPQAEVKQLGADIFTSPWMLIVAVLLGVLLFVRLARR